MLNKLCKLCYRHQNVPESAQIEDCYRESMTDPVHYGEFARVFKGSHQERLVAVKVVQLYSDNREATLRVCVSLMSYYNGSRSYARPRNSAKRR
jgi:hypothetical protein